MYYMLSSLYSARSRRDADGFTLIELLVVVIIIGLLAAIALPIFIDQTKTSVDASVKADVHNTVTNITNAQAQNSTGTKAAVSDANTSVALVVPGGTTEVAIKSSTTLGNVPALGASYSVSGWNPNGKAYLGTAAKPAWTFDSTTGKFAQGAGDAPAAGATTDPGSGTNPSGGGNQTAPAWTTAATLPGGTQNATYNAALVATGNPTPTYSLASGSTLPAGLSLAADGTLSGKPTAAGTTSFTVNALNTTAGTSNVVPRTFSITVATSAAFNATAEVGDATNANWVAQSGAVITPSTDYAHASAYSMPAVLNNTAVTYLAKYNAGSTISASGNYTYSFWVYNTSSSARTLNFQINVSSTLTITAASIPSKTWTQVTGSYSIPAAYTSGSSFQFVWGSAATIPFYVDDFTMAPA